MKEGDKPRIIPRAEMPKGIELCKQNILDFLMDAKLLIGENRLSHSYISIQFAIEELGKLLIFRDKIKCDNSEPLVITKKEAFSNHPIKTKRAWEFLDKNSKPYLMRASGKMVFGKKGCGKKIHMPTTKQG